MNTNINLDWLHRFVDRSDPRGCWNWTGGKGEFGHGRANVGSGRANAEMMPAHHLSYQLHVGPVPAGKIVMHSCDNPGCVNPAHLSVGTQLDNVRDMHTKGRWVMPRTAGPGEGNGNARLSAKDVRDILAAKRAGVSGNELANRYGVSRSHIYAICGGHKWRHVA